MPGWKGAREAERRMLHTSPAGIGVTPAFCVVVLFLL